MKDPIAILDTYNHLCEEIYAFLVEENTLLKGDHPKLSNEFLERKKQFVERSQDALYLMRQISESEDVVKSEQMQSLVDQSKKKIMKIFLINQENEQLLMKQNLSSLVDLNRALIRPKEVESLYQGTPQ